MDRNQRSENDALLQMIMRKFSTDPGSPSTYTADSAGPGLGGVVPPSGSVDDPIKYHTRPGGQVGAEDIQELVQLLQGGQGGGAMPTSGDTTDPNFYRNPEEAMFDLGIGLTAEERQKREQLRQRRGY